MFHVLSLSSDTIASGAMFKISDALDKVFIDTSKAAMEGRTTGNKEPMVILFDNSALTPNYHDDTDDQDTLYLNNAAKKAIEAAGLQFEYSGTVQKAPDNCGVMCQMYRFF
jgi:hypothetical protein